MAYGVIGNTGDFGSLILGSNPSRPANHKILKLVVYEIEVVEMAVCDIVY